MTKQNKSPKPSHTYHLRKRDASGKVRSTKGSGSNAKVPPPTSCMRKAKAAKKELKVELVKQEVKKPRHPQPRKERENVVEEDEPTPRQEKAKKPKPWSPSNNVSAFRMPLGGRGSPPSASASSSATSICPYRVAERIPKSKFEDIAGIDDIKDDIMERIVRPFQYPELAQIMQLEIPRGVLFTGKPGTGKTSLADAIVQEVKKKRKECHYFEESGQCLSKWVGETESGLRRLFQTAAEKSPAIIFFDEVDGIAKKRESGSSSFGTSLVTTLLTEINNVEPGKVLVIAATNTQGMLDPALTRKGRIDVKIDIPLPNREAQQTILRHYFTKKEKRVSPKDVEELVNRLVAYNLAPCDLKWLVEDVQRCVMKKLFRNNEQWGGLSPAALKKILAESKVEELSWDVDLKPSLDRLIKDKEGSVPEAIEEE